MTSNNQFQDEEYQFPHDEYVDNLHVEQPLAEEEAEEKLLLAEEPAAPSAIANIWEKHKRLLVIVGAVVAIAITFSIMRAMHKPVAEVPAMPSTPAAAPAPVVQPMVDPQIIDQLTSLKQDAENSSGVARQLQGQVQQLTDNLLQTRADQQQLTESLMLLAGQVQQLTAEVKVFTQPKPVKVIKVAPKATAPVITFQIRAIVPGRAWIVGSDGQSQSIAVGDNVPQYGTVQSIDADAGVVITTSGKTIKF